MAKHIRHVGSFESTAQANSDTDVAGGFLDLETGGSFARVGAKGPGSIGLKLRTVLAGTALTVLSFTAAGVATFLENVNMSSGKTFAAQAITATSVGASGNVNAASYTINGITAAAGWYAAQNTKGLIVQNSSGSNKVGVQLDGSNVWQFGDGLPSNFNAAITTTLTTGDIFSNISSTGTSIIKVGQGASNNIQLYWAFNAVAGNAIGNIATFGYSNPIRIDGSSVSINSQSGGATSVQALTATTAVVNSSLNNFITTIQNSNANPFAVTIGYNAASPNNTSNQFITCGDLSALRAEIRSNGGLANFSANNVNLSDERVKAFAPGFIDGALMTKVFREVGGVEAFKYKDQTHSDWNIGHRAQRWHAALMKVAPLYAASIVDTEGWKHNGAVLMAMHEADLAHAHMAVTMDIDRRVTQLEQRLAS